MLRAYHSEQVREGQWERMFSRKLRSVVPMNPEYLARNDGSLESAGRGSGLQTQRPQKAPAMIPYMQMAFAPLERRLDTAIFRALFASSARQARQFVVHGAVKVNGKKMLYPGYLLNPGDMFQVEPERVMFATGAPKEAVAAVADGEPETDTETSAEIANDLVEGEDSKNSEEKTEIHATAEEEAEDPRDVLKNLLAQSKSILASPREKLAAKRKQDFRAFQKSVKRLLSKSKSTTILTDSLEAQFLELQNQLNINRDQPQLPSHQKPKGAIPEAESITDSAQTDETKAFDDIDASEPEQQDISSRQVDANREAASAGAGSQISVNTKGMSDREIADLRRALELMQDNPVDDSKPYATPWQPREYMSAFAFIPRYLEVNQNICAAVYLRHPVARPGLGEVPTPFSEGSTASAFAWYLRRR